MTRERSLLSLILILAGVTTVLLLPQPTALAQSSNASWTVTGNLNTARYGHTATLIGNGKVLVVGGITNNANPSNFLNSAELYDPATGTWSVTGSLNLPRYLCSATLLPNGKVLVAGGYTSTDEPSFGITDSVELYDPATGTWSFTGNLSIPRAWHESTLLPNGKVLLEGGAGRSNEIILNTAELYDPAIGKWNATGSLAVARYAHTAIRLQNGNVLVAGGSNDGDLSSTLASAELYDPATGTWNQTSNLNNTRALHTATLLQNGRVVIAGGYNYPPFSLNSAELYDPATGTWSATGSLNSASDSHSATLLPNGQVLLVGGEDWDAPSRPANLNRAEFYEGQVGAWNNTVPINSARYRHTATLLQNGRVLIAGGFNKSIGALNSAELYHSGNTNLIDVADIFVRQHYLDFLNREPDPSGLNFWTGDILLCGADPACVESKRINTSAAFFLSIEFQETGYLVYRSYKSSYGNLPNAPTPIKLNEFLPDTQRIGQGVVVGQTGWEQVLENNKNAFFAAFVQRARFVSAFPTSLAPDQFVDQLFANAAVTPAANKRQTAINEFSSAANTADTAARARALRSVAENPTLGQQEFNRAFVLMQYFGYLRRNPNDPPDTNFEGYNFWLNKLNSFNGDYVQSEMVKAFIVSSEYRQRFAQ